MHKDIHSIYMRLLVDGWKVWECEILGDNVSISLYDPSRPLEEHHYNTKTQNDLGALFRAPYHYLLTPGDKV